MKAASAPSAAIPTCLWRKHDGRWATQSRLRRGLGVCWEICFAAYQHISAPFQLVTTLSDRVGGSVQTGESWGVTRLVRFPRFRTVVIPVPLVVRSVQVRNSRKRTNYALFAGQPLAGALLRLRTTVNMIRMDPMFFATGKTLRRAPSRERVVCMSEKDGHVT